VQHRVPRAVRRRGAAVRLPALAVVQRLAAEGALVNLALVCTAARKATSAGLQRQPAGRGGAPVRENGMP
jgi:hypothetical protein